VAAHARRNRGKGHLTARVGIRVTLAALQAARDMGFVAVGKRLRGRDAPGNIIGDFLFRGLLRMSSHRHQEKRR